MGKIKKKIIEYLIVLLILFIIIIGAGAVLYFYDFSGPEVKLGVNFSNSYAEYLGLDWQKTYLAILDDLKVKYVRLAAPWNELEKEKDVWNFGNLDWQIREAQKRNVDIILVLGRRTPHWPECHDPAWLKNLPDELVVKRQLSMMKNVIERYKKYENIKIWQVENEPLLNAFGVCPKSDLELLRKEIALVKTLDDRPVMITDSGELSFWTISANLGDMFGSTMYRVTYNKWFGYLYYHLPPAFYTIKALIVNLPLNNAIVSELQAEPWSPNGVLNSTLEEQKKSMDAERLIKHVNYAKRTGFSAVYLWGAEWWYWLMTAKNDDTLWLSAREIFQK